jgi:hypothetical protein
MSLRAITPKQETIAKLNDQLRRTFQGGKIMMTASVNALPEATKANMEECSASQFRRTE